MNNSIDNPDFTSYLTYQQLTNALTELAAAYPQMATLHEIGQSHRGRSVWLIEIHNPETGPADTKPGYYIDANGLPEFVPLADQSST